MPSLLSAQSRASEEEKPAQTKNGTADLKILFGKIPTVTALGRPRTCRQSSQGWAHTRWRSCHPLFAAQIRMLSNAAQQRLWSLIC